jgi:hypothetical protein
MWQLRALPIPGRRRTSGDGGTGLLPKSEERKDRPWGNRPWMSTLEELGNGRGDADGHLATNRAGLLKWGQHKRARRLPIAR